MFRFEKPEPHIDAADLDYREMSEFDIEIWKSVMSKMSKLSFGTSENGSAASDLPLEGKTLGLACLGLPCTPSWQWIGVGLGLDWDRDGTGRPRGV